MQNPAVVTAFRGKDETSAVFGQMGNAAERYQRRTSSAFRNATKEGYKFATIVKGILAANILRGGIGMIGSSVRNAATSFIDFDDTIVRAAIHFDDIGAGAKNLKAEVASLKKETLTMAQGTPFLPVEIAKGIDELAKSGFLRNKGALGIMKGIMNVSVAAGEDLATTTTNLSDMMGSFGLRTNDAAQAMKNFNRLSDVMTMTANLSNVGISDLKETMEAIGPLSVTMGVSLEAVGAMAAILGNAGVKGTEAATAFKAIMVAIADPVRSKIIANSIGGLYDATGKLKSIPQILAESVKSMNGLTSLEKTGVFFKMFGLRGVASSGKLARSFEEFADKWEKLQKAGGSTNNMANAIAKLSLSIKLTTLKNAALSKMFEIFESFKYGNMSGIEALTEKLKNLNLKTVIIFLHATASALTILYKVMEPFLPILPYFVAGFYAIKTFKAGIDFFKFASTLGGILPWLDKMPGAIGAITREALLLGGELALIAAGFIAIKQAYDSFKTGKDNWFSRKAQDFGIVPKLSTDKNGVVTGYDQNQYEWWDWINRKPSAPNQREVQSRSQFNGTLNINGAPPGSTFTNMSPAGAPGLNVNLIGPNP